MMLKNESQAFSNADLRGVPPVPRAASVHFAFHFPELVESFAKYDKQANRMRRNSRRLGFSAIFLVFVALLIAAGDPLTQMLDERARAILPYVAGALGVFGTVAGLVGLRRGAARLRWLVLRYRTETLRLFHFHYIAARMPTIVEAAENPRKRARYLRDRAKSFERFCAELADLPHDALAERLEDPDGLPLTRYAQMEPCGSRAITPEAAAVFAAWLAVRPEWQLSYCEAKLDERPFGIASSHQQEHLLSTIAWSCIGAIAALHVLHFATHWFHFTEDDGPIIQMLVIWTALVALAVRALEGGLAPQREVERYKQYRRRILSSIERFREADSFAGRTDVMRSFESASLDEMNLFMCTHRRASFLL